MLIAAAGSTSAYLLFGRGDSEESRVEKVVADFAHAVDRGDRAKVIGMLCPEEARDITGDRSEAGAPERDTKSKPIPVDTADVKIKGDIASVRVTRPAQEPTRLYLRKEKGTWTVCAPAGDSVRGPSGGSKDTDARTVAR